MPYVWTDPDVYFVHKDVTIYYVYKSDEMEQGARTYWYGSSANCSDSVGHGENGTFDVREFAREDDGDEFSPETNDGRMALIRRAIETGDIINEDEEG